MVWKPKSGWALVVWETTEEKGIGWVTEGFLEKVMFEKSE